MSNKIFGVSFIIILTFSLVLLFNLEYIQKHAFAQQPNLITKTQNMSKENGNTTNSVPINKFYYFQSPLFGKVIYPSTWRESNSSPDYTIVGRFVSPLENISDFSPAVVTISVVNYRSNVTLNDFTNTSIKDLTTSGKFKIISSKPIVIDGLAGHSLIFSTQGNQQLTSYTLRDWTVKNNNVYIFTFSADLKKYTEYLPTISRMINSMKIM